MVAHGEPASEAMQECWRSAPAKPHCQMPDPDHREDGFYWISVDGQEAEVAQWQMEWGQWLVAGSTRPLSDGWATRVTVLSDRLSPPAMPVSLSVAAG